MARRGDGIYLRGKAWWLDCVIHGKRYQLSLGRRINRSAALEVASIRRAQILKGEAGIRRPKEISFPEAKDLFLKWLEANKRANTAKSCRSHMKQLQISFGNKNLSAISPFVIEKHKIRRLHERCPVALNRELAYLKLLFNKCQKWKKYEGANPSPDSN
jgi:hypothetical protein